METRLQVAVITGGHHFPVIPFTRFWQTLPGVDAWIQGLDDFVGSPEAIRHHYDALVFYHMPRGTPPQKNAPGYGGNPEEVLEELALRRPNTSPIPGFGAARLNASQGQLASPKHSPAPGLPSSPGQTTPRGPQGLVILHHGVLAHPDWPVWDLACAMTQRRTRAYAHDVEVRHLPAHPPHPISRGIGPFTLVDETYDLPEEPLSQAVPVFRTDTSGSCPVLAWTLEGHPREGPGESPGQWPLRDQTSQVSPAEPPASPLPGALGSPTAPSDPPPRTFCWLAGHDEQAYAHPAFRRVLNRALRWTTHRL